MLQDPNATGLLVFPTKALAGDQAEKWNGAVTRLPGIDDPRSLFAVPFDGDSNAADRRVARDSARLLVTNPEMIHANLLPGHSRWQRFLHGLNFVVLDEVHTYTGFFGANMANVIRRLDRICEHYGGKPQYVCSSATIGNPNEVAELLVNRPFRVI
ncbi:MAG: DEAD/DEAH box helicase, partial [Planctomycetota bacterium]|nr:DEAD/DEAH box helicase [Planctomycetota bacterium]